MKKLLLILLLSLGLIGLSYAHSGRTDSKGGHWNHSTDTYHYHSKSNGSNSGDQDYLINLKDSDDHPEPCRYSRSKANCLYWQKRTRELFFEQLFEQRKINSSIYNF
jgi:hypothetical protein